jgi:hypothetical protein
MECKSKAGKHHIIFKGNKSIIVYLPINEVDLCKQCHIKIHSDKDMDYKYKAILQARLQKLLPCEYYCLNSVKSILKLNNLQTKVFSKNVHPYKNGYKSCEIIKYLMGGKLY